MQCRMTSASSLISSKVQVCQKTIFSCLRSGPTMKSIRTGEGYDLASFLSLTTQEGALDYQAMAMQRAIEEASK